MTSIPSAFRALATRWPPEISPGSTALLSGKVVASAAGVVVALTVGGLLGPIRRLGPAAYGSLSVQVVDRAFHVVGQVQCVVADEPLGKLAVAGLERLDDVHVVDDRALGPVVLADGPAPDRPHVDVQVLDELQDHRRLRELDDALVEAQVGHRVLVEVRAQLAVLELREQRAERPDLLVGRALAHEPRGHRLEGRPDHDHLDDLGLALADDVDAAARDDADQAFVLEARERLPHGRAADAEPGGERLLVEPEVSVIVVDVHREDGVAERLVGELTDAGLGGERRDDQLAAQLLGNELRTCRLDHHHVPMRAPCAEGLLQARPRPGVVYTRHRISRQTLCPEANGRRLAGTTRRRWLHAPRSVLPARSATDSGYVRCRPGASTSGSRSGPATRASARAPARTAGRRPRRQSP